MTLPSGFSTFGTLSTSGVIVDRFGVGFDFRALTFADADLGYGANQFYFLRTNPADADFSTLGTISTSGVVTDRFGVGSAFHALVFPRPVTVSVDIKPGLFPNTLNPASKGKVPVAVLSTSIFDATTVDGSSVRFGPTGTEAAPVHVSLSDVNGDGRIDMILQFAIGDTGIPCGATRATLMGRTGAGVVIRGTDAIVTVGCG